MKNMKTYKNIFLLSFLLAIISFSCSPDKKESLISITIPIYETTPFNISDIADKVTPIQLELTDESIIGDWRKGYRVLFTDNHIVFFDNSVGRSGCKIFLFDKDGKFIRSIGKRGRGPGEYTAVLDIAIDAAKQLVYVMTLPKILCYDLDGNFIKEKSLMRFVEGASFLNNQLVFLETRTIKEGNEYNHQTLSFKANEDLEITDSLVVQNRLSNIRIIYSPTVKDYFTTINNKTYFYFPNKSTPCDTLFKMVDDELTPSVEVKFDTQDPFSAAGIFKTSRFIIVTYNGYRNYFCYDTHLNKRYNMEGGVMDDIHVNTEVRIRLNPADGNQFYYLHENISDEEEELNPVLYIGEFKK